MDRHTPHVLSPVPEEDTKPLEKVRDDKKQDKYEKEKVVISEIESDSDDDGALPLEINVHGLKAKVYLNCADIDIIPARYLEKADCSYLLKRNPWIFRAAKDGREVDIRKWSKVDIRFRGVFKTLKKVPSFKHGLFDGDNTGSWRMSSSSSSSSSKIDFEEAVKAQGQVVYALLDEISNMLKLRREMDNHRQFFFLRLVSCKPEYWTGYRAKHRDSPYTAGSLSLDYEPYRGMPHVVVPVVTTADRKQSLKKALEGEFKLLLAQYLVNIHCLSPPGDRFPDQEGFLISLHGSKLHILRGIFPGQKTSRVWCGRHRPSDIEETSTNNHVSGMNMNERFYSKTNIDRFMEKVEWDQLSNPNNESEPRAFQILASREYDLWVKWEFVAAQKMLCGMLMYLMSGQARCGVLQEVFGKYPYDEGYEANSDDEKEKAAKEQQEIEEKEAKMREFEQKKREESKAKAVERENMRTSMRDKFGGIAEGLCQPWWDWVWDDKKNETRAKKADDELIVGGPSRDY